MISVHDDEEPKPVKQVKNAPLNTWRASGYEILGPQLSPQAMGRLTWFVRKGTFIVFVEVKTMSYSFYGEPEAFVDSRKAATVIRAAEQYTTKINMKEISGFDIVFGETGINPRSCTWRCVH